MTCERRDRRRTLERLNAALVSEIVRVHRRPGALPRDQRRADLIAERIVRLGGAPDYSSLRSALRARALGPRREPSRA